MSEVWRLRSYYDLLEVARSADAETIRSAYRLQSQAWSPDKMPEQFRAVATERMAAINEAYATLNNARKRERYDASLPPEDVEFAVFDEPLQNLPEVWKRMAAWMKDQDVGEGFDRKMAYTAGDLLERRREASAKQLPHMLRVWELAITEGFDPTAEDVEVGDE